MFVRPVHFYALTPKFKYYISIFYKRFSKLKFIFQTNLCKIDQIYLDDFMRIFISGLKQETTLKMTSLVHYKLDKITITTNTTFTQCFNNIRYDKTNVALKMVTKFKLLSNRCG